MSKIFEVYNQAIKEGKPFDILSEDLRILIAHYEGFQEPIDVLFRKEEEMKHEAEFNSGFERLKKQEPVEYIINESSFLGHKLYVDERVLIPRMETQELVSKISEVISRYFDPRNYLVVADIGCGSGAISIALKSLFKNWLITASDISSEALEVAKKNIEASHYSIQTLWGDSLEPYIQNNMALDVIVSNPPYILNHDDVQKSVKEFEPSLALYLNKEDSVYEKIFKNVYKVKKGSLFMAFEIGYDLESYLTDLMKKYLKDYEFEFVKDIDEQLRFLFVYLN